MEIRSLTMDDAPALLALHLAASQPPSGLAREPDEVDLAFVQAFLKKAHTHGLALGAFEGGELCGEIHAARLGPRQFASSLTDLTIAVHPAMQGRGLGRRLFEALFAEAAKLEPPVDRIELLCRSGHAGALRLYESLGFVAEGRFIGRVRLHNGTVEDDIPMVRRM